MQTLPDRIEQKIAYEPNSSCWLWIGSWDKRGYGHFGLNGKTRRVHRYVYELLRGPIPEGLTLDHLCRVPCCVNPAHLEPVTHRENVLRGDGPSAREARITHCRRGHPYDAKNTYRWNGHRYCRRCSHRWLEARFKNAPKTVACLCGCGTLVPAVNNKGRRRMGWAQGHNAASQAQRAALARWRS